MTPFTTRVIDIVRSIPPGKVMTYGQVAACAGSPGAARQVVRLLHSMSGKYELPWHRIINATGAISLPEDEAAAMQRLMLESEGIAFADSRRIELQRYLFVPEP